jgi:hypothetical protein
VWPFWVPFLLWCKESQPVRKRILLGLTLFSTVWLWTFYLPLALGPAELLTTQVRGHSIAYRYADLAILRAVPAGVTELCYLLLVTVPFVLGTPHWQHAGAFAVAASAAVSYVLFEHAFVSVWCFFAALLAAYLVQLFRRLPAAAATQE